MDYLLHIDTSTDVCTVALGLEGQLVDSGRSEESRNHASTINNLIAGLLEKVQISFENIGAVVVCAGPGSYTGLRIGLATAKGICYATNKPLMLDNRLTLLAYQGWRAFGSAYDQYISLLTARIGEYFISIYDCNFTCILAPQHIMDSQLARLLDSGKRVFLTTNAGENALHKINFDGFKINNHIEIDLISWCFYAFEELKCNNIVNLSTAEPFYLKQVYTHK